MLHDIVRCSGLLVALQPRVAAPGHDPFLCLHGCACGVCLCHLLQNVQGRGDGPAEEHGADRDSVPGGGLPHLLRAQPHDLGGSGHGSGALRHSGGASAVLVCAEPPAGVSGELFGVQEGRCGAACAHKRHPEADPRADLVHEVCTVGADGGGAPIRGSLRRALLHPLVHMAAPVLLSVWVHAARAGDPGGDVCGDHHRDVLLPALQ
mmetsp:Transcript_2389/g.4788  ORF Transcript_2389/g.4788 Transcript_2389/m.4788 type:complete len:207 (+) Transcript_2389:1182-1802(+)